MKTNSPMTLKIILLAVAAHFLLVWMSGQIARWRFRQKVLAYLEACYPDDTFSFEGSVAKVSHIWGPASRFQAAFNPTGSKSHPLYWYKYSGTVVSRQLGARFEVGGRPWREQTGGHWNTAYFHDTWTEMTDALDDRTLAERYEGQREQRLANRIRLIWEQTMPTLQARQDYYLTRNRALYVAWHQAFRALRNEQHVRIYRASNEAGGYDPLPAGPLADLHARLHAQRHFQLWLFRDSANAAHLTAPQIAAALQRFARRAARETGIDGTLHATVIDREPLMRDAAVWYDLFRSYHSGKDYVRTYRDWPAAHQHAYDAVRHQSLPTDEDRRILEEVLASETTQLRRLDHYILGRYASPFTPEARVQAAHLPAAWTAALDRALQQELRRTFGPDAYGRFEPYRPTDAHCLVDADLGQGEEGSGSDHPRPRENSRQDAAHPSDPNLRPLQGWQATVYLMAGSQTVAPPPATARRFAASLEKQTGIRATVDVYVLSKAGLRHLAKNLLLTPDIAPENFRDAYYFGLHEALFSDSLPLYKYVEDWTTHPTTPSEAAGTASRFYRLMRPRADLDLVSRLSPTRSPLILRHYRMTDGRLQDLTAANPLTRELLEHYEKLFLPIHPALDKASAQEDRQLRFFHLLLSSDESEVLDYHFDLAARAAARAKVHANLCGWRKTPPMVCFALRHDQQRVLDYLAGQWKQAGDTLRQSLLFTLDLMTTDIGSERPDRNALPAGSYSVAQAIHHGIWDYGRLGNELRQGTELRAGSSLETDPTLRAARRATLQPLVKEALHAAYAPLRQQAVRMLGNTDKAALRDRLLNDPAPQVQCEAALRLSRMTADTEALSILQERIRQGKRRHTPRSEPRPDQVAMIAVQALAGEDWGMKLLYTDYQVIYAGAKAKKKALAYSFPAAAKQAEGRNLSK